MATYSVSSKESPCPQDSIKESTHTKDNRILTCIANQNIMIEQRRSKNLKDLVRSGSHIHIHKYQVLWFLQNGSIHTACTTPTAWCTLTWTNRQSNKRHYQQLLCYPTMYLFHVQQRNLLEKIKQVWATIYRPNKTVPPLKVL